MALKSDRQVDAVELGYFLNATASQGVVVSKSTSGSGVAMEDTANLLQVSSTSSGVYPVGMLLTEVVNLDLTRTPINWHKDQVQVGSKVTVMTKGWAVTDQISGTPTVNSFAVLGSSGVVTTYTATTWTQEVNPKVGKFRTLKDADGYARVYVDL